MPRKIKLFISSCMRSERFLKIRSEIERKFHNCRYLDLYLFEFSGASTVSAETDYRMQVRDSDLCIFIIDDNYQVTPGVQNELDEAKANKKKSLYYFYKEDPEKVIELQNELRGPDAPKTYEVKSLEKLPDQLISDLEDEILDRFHEYCQEWLIYDTQGSNSPVDISASISSFTAITKSSFENYAGTQAYLTNFIFGKSRDCVFESELDEYTTSIAKVILEGKPIKEFNASLLAEEIEERIPAEYNQAIAKRWSGIQHYWKGEKGKAADSFAAGLELAKTTNLPQWFIYDILIDLRNVSLELFDFNSHERYQKEINSNDSLLVYPLIDRLNGKAFEELVKESVKKGKQSVGTITYGDNVSEFLETLAKIIGVAVLFGSWTYLTLIPSKIELIANSLLQWHDSSVLKETLLKLTLTKGKHKETARLLNSNSSMFDGMTQSSASEIYQHVRACAAPLDNHSALFEAFSWLGSYLTDDKFQSTFCEIKDIIESELTTLPRPSESLFEALASNSERIEPEWAAITCCRAIEHGKDTYWRSGALSYAACGICLDDLSDETSKRYLDALESCIDQKESFMDKVSRALLLARLKSSKFEDRISSLHAKLPAYYLVNDILNRGGKNQTDLIKLLNSEIDAIRTDNRDQGANGIYSVPMRNRFKILQSIFEQIPSPSQAQLESVVFASIETINTQRQLPRTKHQAILLLIYLAIKSGKVNVQLGQSIKNDNINPKAERVFDNYCQATLDFAYEALLFVTNQCTSSALRLALTKMYRLSNFEKAVSLDVLRQVLSPENHSNNISSSLKSAILSYLFYLTSSEKRELRLPAYELMGLLLADQEVGIDASTFFLDSFAQEQPVIKAAILRMIFQDPLNEHLEALKQIIKAGKQDSNYLVRNLANKIAESH